MQVLPSSPDRYSYEKKHKCHPRRTNQSHNTWLAIQYEACSLPGMSVVLSNNRMFKISSNAKLSELKQKFCELWALFISFIPELCLPMAFLLQTHRINNSEQNNFDSNAKYNLYNRSAGSTFHSSHFSRSFSASLGFT